MHTPADWPVIVMQIIEKDLATLLYRYAKTRICQLLAMTSALHMSSPSRHSVTQTEGMAMRTVSPKHVPKP